MKSDEYQDRKKFGKTIIFLIGCNPYQGIEKAFKVPKVIYEEFEAWKYAEALFKRGMHVAQITEIFRKAGY